MKLRVVHGHVLILILATTATVAVAQAPGTGHTAEINGIQMHYEIVGDGDPLLLLHSGTQTSRMWDEFVDRFSEHYRLIIPDLRGHGGSTNPDGLWTTRQFADDVFALLDHLDVDRVRAVGASAGAMTLLQMATRKPDRIEAMVVIGVGTYPIVVVTGAFLGVFKVAFGLPIVAYVVISFDNFQIEVGRIFQKVLFGLIHPFGSQPDPMHKLNRKNVHGHF